MMYLFVGYLVVLILLYRKQQNKIMCYWICKYRMRVSAMYKPKKEL